MIVAAVAAEKSKMRFSPDDMMLARVDYFASARAGPRENAESLTCTSMNIYIVIMYVINKFTNTKTYTPPWGGWHRKPSTPKMTLRRVDMTRWTKSMSCETGALFMSSAKHLKTIRIRISNVMMRAKAGRKLNGTTTIIALIVEQMFALIYGTHK